MHELRLVVLTVLLAGLSILLVRSVARSLRTGTVTLRGGLKCRRSSTPICFWSSIIVTLAAVGVLLWAWLYAIFLQRSFA